MPRDLWAPGYPRNYCRTTGKVDVTIEGPSWLGIGAQRCGTTWLTDLVTQHPLMDVPGGKKEHHWLYRYGLMHDWSPEAREEYRRTFSHPEVRMGEFTPYYLRSPWIVELTRDALPESAPIFVILRDPIDRFASALRHEIGGAQRRYAKHIKKSPTRQAKLNDYVPRRLPDLPKDVSPKKLRKAVLDRVAKASSAWWVQGPPKDAPEVYLDRTWLRFVGSDASWGGMFAAHLDAWTKVFAPERFVVIQYEQMRRDPQHYADLIWKRLGLDPIPLEGIDKKSRSSSKSDRWVPDDYPHVVRALQQMYRPDCERLAAQFDVDLTLWKRTMTDL